MRVEGEEKKYKWKILKFKAWIRAVIPTSYPGADILT
jgi:hypothetical protein